MLRVDVPERQPIFTWRAHANLLWRNWLNYVYQMTPYELETMPAVKAQLAEQAAAEHGVPAKL